MAKLIFIRGRGPGWIEVGIIVLLAVLGALLLAAKLGWL